VPMSWVHGLVVVAWSIILPDLFLYGAWIVLSMAAPPRGSACAACFSGRRLLLSSGIERVTNISSKALIATRHEGREKRKAGNLSSTEAARRFLPYED